MSDRDLARQGNSIAVTDGPGSARPSLLATLSSLLPQGGVSNRQVGSPPAGPPNFAHLSPEGGFGQNFRDFLIFTGSDFELSRSVPECVKAQLLKSGFTCENHEFQ